MCLDFAGMRGGDRSVDRSGQGWWDRRYFVHGSHLVWLVWSCSVLDGHPGHSQHEMECSLGLLSLYAVGIWRD